MRTFLLLLVLLSPDPAYAGDPRALIPDMQRWLAKQGRITQDPEIEVVEQERLNWLTQNPQARGACLHGVIYLSNRLGFNTPIEQALVLHELVHMSQNRCEIPRDRIERQQMEEDAYNLQSKWHKEKTGRPLTFSAQASLRNL